MSEQGQGGRIVSDHVLLKFYQVPESNHDLCAVHRANTLTCRYEWDFAIKANKFSLVWKIVHPVWLQFEIVNSGYILASVQFGLVCNVCKHDVQLTDPFLQVCSVLVLSLQAFTNSRRTHRSFVSNISPMTCVWVWRTSKLISILRVYTINWMHIWLILPEIPNCLHFSGCPITQASQTHPLRRWNTPQIIDESDFQIIISFFIVSS